MSSQYVLATQYSRESFILSLMESISRANTAEKLKTLIDQDLKSLVPHKMSMCCLKNVKTGVIRELVNVSMPDGYLSTIVKDSPEGRVLCCPATKRWSMLRETVYLESTDSYLSNSNNRGWLMALEHYALRNSVIGGIMDVSGAFTSVICFVGIPEEQKEKYIALIDCTIPVMHRALINIHQNQKIETSENDAFNLTVREKEMLDLISKGLRNEQIAASLGISVNTVRCHLKNLNVKLRVTSRTQALVEALKMGVIEVQ